MPSSSAACDLDAAGPPQRLGDVLALDVLDVLLEVEPAPGSASAAAAGARSARRTPRTRIRAGCRAGSTGVRSSATARSMAFSSSRMLPGQSYACSSAIAAPEMPAIGLPICAANLGDEVLGQQRDVLAPLAQRRQPHRDDVDAVEQVLAERALGHHLRQVPVGRGDDADVGLDLVGAAEPAEPALLQHAQQLHLHERAHLADLVEEDVPFSATSISPFLLVSAPGERAAHVAEQLGLEQRLGQRAAVERDERPVACAAS